jgi:hypothetical protein
MTSLFRRASFCAGLAICGFSALSQAQSTSTVLPQRPTELRRAPFPVAAAPIVQQSPNGLYTLSITDIGIELLGPKGVVKITDAGIEIGAPNTTRVVIMARDMNVRSAKTVRLEAGSTMDISGGLSTDIRAGATIDIKGGSTVQITSAAEASLIGSQVTLGNCSNRMPVARAGDKINTTVSPAVILPSSTTVRAC